LKLRQKKSQTLNIIKIAKFNKKITNHTWFTTPTCKKKNDFPKKSEKKNTKQKETTNRDVRLRKQISNLAFPLPRDLAISRYQNKAWFFQQ